ncbi:MAG TPA: alpha/beta hydrolase [Devosia sp.]|jgi:pimeloyl-ACP methyl ester carboxylesterase|uniref:alpha/beta fold hydrolase n=1 Tax=Devosia sp. TaxID=1871048 RepID=UPI002DDD9A42|nr:alpha/beta hydrolase [Devosia sp.]HEV2516159.1 alpha/beta hydrolase [Devosia sp.]
MPSIFRTPGDRTAYLAAYDEMLRRWPRPSLRSFDTGLGSTNVIEVGDRGLPPLVLLPPVSVSATAWFPIVGMLCRHHRVFAFDVVGDAGRSTLTRMPRSGADYADWLVECFHALGLERPAVAGHSYGGWLALQLAVNRPSATGPIILLSPASGLYPFHWYARLFLWLAEKLPFRPPARQVLGAQVHRGYELDETFVALMDAVSAHVRTHVLFPTPLSDDELTSVRMPTLVLIGESEPLYDATAALERARLLLPNVDARLVPKASHLLPMERPGFVDAAIEAFLEEAEAAVRIA